MTRCVFIKTNGEQCKAAATKASHDEGSPRCYLHSLTPEQLKDLTTRAGASPRKWELKLPDLKGPEDAKEALSILSEALANGRIPTDRGRAMLDVVRSWLDAHRMAQEEAREAEHQARFEAARARQGATP